jgi:hypothetical protein
LNYLIKGIGEDKTVELWSTKRLPFETKGWLKVMREELKKELKLLKRKPNEILYGSFQSSSGITGYDVENILFYNVGNSAFSHLKITDICFEKSFNNIEAPLKEFDELVNSHSLYKLHPRDRLEPYWKKKNVLASWENVNLLNVKDAYSYWCSMRQGPVILHAANDDNEFGLEITLHLSRKEKFSLPSDSMKKLLDGVICAFHIHNGLNEEEIANRLSKKLQLNAGKIREMLQDDSTNLLGGRSIFNLYREDSLFCNPADDLCVFVRITIVPTDCVKSMISGQLFSVAGGSF